MNNKSFNIFFFARSVLYNACIHLRHSISISFQVLLSNLPQTIKIFIFGSFCLFFFLQNHQYFLNMVICLLTIYSDSHIEKLNKFYSYLLKSLHPYITGVDRFKKKFVVVYDTKLYLSNYKDIDKVIFRLQKTHLFTPLQYIHHNLFERQKMSYPILDK